MTLHAKRKKSFQSYNAIQEVSSNSAGPAFRFYTTCLPISLENMISLSLHRFTAV